MDEHQEDTPKDATEDQNSNSPEVASIKYRSEFSPLRTPPPQNSVFLIDESTFHPALPKISHWSIAWSDLMMTMFVLFLSMFVYQASHKEFLVSDDIEIIGGDTSAALEITEEGSATFPFMPIKPSAPLITSGTVKKVEPITLQDIDADTVFFDDKEGKSLARIRDSVLKPLPVEEPMEEKTKIEPPQPEEVVKETIEKKKPILVKPKVSAPAPIETEEQNDINEIFTINKDNLAYYNLEKFASIKLVPDKTVRIILTGDLLFKIGSADLSSSAIISLHKMALAIEDTPYMINVVGHTDNVPMKSTRYSSNWELSLSRASAVARFLIEEIGMSPLQFVVSGYSSYRPVVSNTNVNNRAQNRRVEIIISKYLPKPKPATKANLQ